MAQLIAARLRLPLFSIKHPEAFQVMSSLPLPQPSSLIGLLAYCVGVAKGIGTKALEEVMKWVEDGKLLAARATLATDSLPMTPSSVVLRRFRVVDKAHEAKRKGIPKPIDRLAQFSKQGDFRSAKALLEVELMDAFYREYVMGHELLCVWALEDETSLEPSWLYLAQRLGDTESLCTVISVETHETRVYETDKIRTKFPTPLEGLSAPVEGPHTVAKMCDELRALRPYIIPCEVKMRKRKEGPIVPVIRPSEVKVSYEEPVRVIEAENIILTAFWPVRRTKRGKR